MFTLFFLLSRDQTVLARLEDRNSRAAVVETQAIANGVSLLDHVKSLRESLAKLKDAAPSSSPQSAELAVPSSDDGSLSAVDAPHSSPLITNGDQESRLTAAPLPPAQGMVPRPPPPRPAFNPPKQTDAASPKGSDVVNPLAALNPHLPPPGFVTSSQILSGSAQKPAWYQNVTQTIGSFEDEPPPPRPLPGSTSEEKYVDVIAAAFGSESRKIGDVLAVAGPQLLSSTPAPAPVPVLTQNVFASLSSGSGVSSWAAMMAKRRQQAPTQ